MAISFPSSPSDADQYTFNGVTYEYEASTNKWKVVDNGSIMNPATYDPQSIASDAFNRANHTGTPTFVDIVETVYNLTGTDIDPANGTIQYKTLSANTTFTEALASGKSVTLRLEGGDSYTVTWPTMTWVGGSAPTLTADDVLVIWQEQTTVYGAYIGSFA